LVVHDRIHVEATVLPRYFNHSSFASLRRQLNYFNFVRLGKGRQRESTYINESVIELDDILALRRRSTGAAGGGGGQTSYTSVDQSKMSHQEKTNKQRPVKVKSSPKANYVDSIVPVVHLPSKKSISKLTATKRTKRVKHAKTNPIVLPPVTAPFVSEDEESQANVHKSFAVDLTGPLHDPDILLGCTALLGLSGKIWL